MPIIKPSELLVKSTTEDVSSLSYQPVCSPAADSVGPLLPQPILDFKDASDIQAMVDKIERTAASYAAQQTHVQTQPQVNHTDTRHAFSRTLAKDIGIVPALLAKYIGYRLGRTKHKAGERPTFYATTDALHAQYPYLSRATVFRAVQALLTNEILEGRNYNKKKYDETKWFHMTDENRNKVEHDLVYFLVSEAYAYGLKEAIVLNHVRYSIQEHPEILEEGWIRVAPVQWQRHQPFFSCKEIRDRLKRLVQKRALEAHPLNESSGRARRYRIGSFGH